MGPGVVTWKELSERGDHSQLTGSLQDLRASGNWVSGRGRHRIKQGRDPGGPSSCSQSPASLASQSEKTGDLTARKQEWVVQPKSCGHQHLGSLIPKTHTAIQLSIAITKHLR